MVVSTEIQTILLNDIKEGKVPAQFAGVYSTQEIISIIHSAIAKMNTPAEEAWDDEFKVTGDELIAMNFIEGYVKQLTPKTDNRREWQEAWDDDEDVLLNA